MGLSNVACFLLFKWITAAIGFRLGLQSISRSTTCIESDFYNRLSVWVIYQGQIPKNVLLDASEI